MGLFDKKDCSICGRKIGLLGNRKLADGNLCKDCASLLSPFMTDRRQSTVEEIRQHLEYRRQNAAYVGTLQPTKVLGTRTKVYVDEPQGLFIVTDRSSWQNGNPDVMSIDQVAGIEINVRENRREIPPRREGEPPRMEFSYHFHVVMHINSPYFDEIRFELTDFAEPPRDIHSPYYHEMEYMAGDLQHTLMPQVYAAPILIREAVPPYPMPGPGPIPPRPAPIPPRPAPVPPRPAPGPAPVPPRPAPGPAPVPPRPAPGPAPAPQRPAPGPAPVPPRPAPAPQRPAPGPAQRPAPGPAAAPQRPAPGPAQRPGGSPGPAGGAPRDPRSGGGRGR